MMTVFWRRGLSTGLQIAALCATVHAVAEPNQALESITQAAISATQDRARDHGYDMVSVEVQALDSQLALPQCPKPLATIISETAQVLGPVSVGIRCGEGRLWTIYVRAEVSAQQEVPVLAGPLARNSIISRNDLKMVSQPLQADSNGIILDPDQIVGMELTRSLDANSPLKVNQLRLPKVVKRGQQVTMVAGIKGLEVRIQGKALGDAVAGERVTVANTDTGKRIEGVALADGTVSVQ